MNSSKQKFGQLDGKEVDLYILENDNGMKAKVTSYGGILTSLTVPDKNGTAADVCCGFDTLDGYFSDAYKANSPYLGCIVGLYAGLAIMAADFTMPLSAQHQMAARSSKWVNSGGTYAGLNRTNDGRAA